MSTEPPPIRRPGLLARLNPATRVREFRRTCWQLAGLWPYLAFPPFAIIAFALNQWLAHGLNRQRLPGVATHTVLASAQLQRSLPVVLPLLGERVGVGTGALVRPQGFIARRLA